MSLIAKKSAGANIAPLAGGTYIFTCVGIIDLGTQYNERYKTYSDKALVIFEIPSETVEIDGEQKPRWLSKEYTKSLSNKGNLKKDLESWLGRSLTDDEVKDGYDRIALLGRGGQISVIVEDKEDRHFNKISSIIGLPKGMKAPTPLNELIAYDIDAHSEDVFQKLPEWIRNRIKSSQQWKESGRTEEIDFETGEVSEENDTAAPF